MIPADAILVFAVFLGLYLFERWQTRREGEPRYLVDQVPDVEAMLHAERWDRRVDESRYAPVYQLDVRGDAQ